MIPDIKLVNENGVIKGIDPETGNEVPVSFDDLDANSLNIEKLHTVEFATTESEVSSKLADGVNLHIIGNVTINSQISVTDLTCQVTIHGQIDNQTSGSYWLKIENSGSGSTERVRVVGKADDAVNITGDTNSGTGGIHVIGSGQADTDTPTIVAFEDVTVHDLGGDGLRAENCWHATFDEGCEVRGVGGHGFIIDGCHDSYYRSHSSNCGGDAVRVTAASGNVFEVGLRGGTAENSNVNIRFTDGGTSNEITTAHIAGMGVDDAVLSGVWLDSGIETVTIGPGTSIEFNNKNDNGSHGGVKVDTGTCLVAGASFLKNYRSGIRADGGITMVGGSAEFDGGGATHARTGINAPGGTVKIGEAMVHGYQLDGVVIGVSESEVDGLRVYNNGQGGKGRGVKLNMNDCYVRLYAPVSYP